MDRRRFLASLAAVPLAPALVRAARPRAAVCLVTADLEHRLVALDAVHATVLGHVPTLPGPRSIETVGGGRLALVCHTSVGAISLVDASTLAVRHELGGFREPRYTAAAPDGRHAYVTDAALGQLVVIDLAAARIVARIEVGALARHITIHPAGRTIWIALGPRADAIAVVDASDPVRPRLRHRLIPPFLAHDVGYAPDARRVVVTSGAEAAIAVHDARTGRPLRRLADGEPPQHVVVLARAAFVTSGDSESLTVHSLEDGRLLHRAWVPTGSYNITYGAGRLCTPSLDAGTALLADLQGVPLHRERVARSAHDACILPAP